MRAVRVLIVDDHTMFREGIASLLKDRREVEVVGEAADGLEAVERAIQFAPDVVLMDLSMPRCGGVEATRLIREKAPQVRVIALTVSENDEDLYRAVEAGARGYLLKKASAAELVEAIRLVDQGHVVLAPTVADRLLAEVRTPPAQKGSVDAVGGLTERERQILVMVGEGYTNKEIARKLFVSEATVRGHLSKILERFHLRRRVDAAVYAAQHGLVSSDCLEEG